MKKVLVIGGGGREHAIVDALSRSPQVGKIYCAPGNAGISEQAECVSIKDMVYAMWLMIQMQYGLLWENLCHADSTLIRLNVEERI